MFRWWNIPLSTYPKSSLENTHLSRGLLPFIHKAHHINAGLRNTDTRCPFYLIPENIFAIYRNNGNIDSRTRISM